MVSVFILVLVLNMQNVCPTMVIFTNLWQSLTDTIQDYLDISDNTPDGFNADGYDISEYLVAHHFVCNTLHNH